MPPRINSPSSVRRLDVTARRLVVTGMEAYCPGPSGSERGSFVGSVDPRGEDLGLVGAHGHAKSGWSLLEEGGHSLVGVPGAPHLGHRARVHFVGFHRMVRAEH